jgi:lysophospholipid acyltransferase (LPLAT)-like uncharacterized protein
MSLVKRLTAARWFQRTVAFAAAQYLRLVWKTTRFEFEPAGIVDEALADLPMIIVMWHGQHFLSPFVRSEHPAPAKVLVSRHRDGEINALVAEYFGVGTIRGSGAHGREFQRKGGVTAFHQMREALAQGYNLAMTADVPKIARVAGLGVVKLAAMSGRPIYALAIATSNRITLKNWDRTTINLPFGRGAMVGAGPFRVAADADEASLEAVRRTIERDLNAATARAYALVDKAKAEHVR